jgi:hypothetical protein
MSSSEQQHPMHTLQDIRSIMERSARFLSLSGWSGIWAGATAMVSATAAYNILHSYYLDYNSQGGFDTSRYIGLRNNLFILGIITLIVAIGGGYFFTLRKVRQQGGTIWNSASRKALINLAIPLVTGAVVIIGFLYHDDWTYVSSSCLIFYGLGLINASKYTIDDVRYLGLCQVLLGLCGLFAPPSWGLYLWAIGFGILHIVYGAVMWNKYDRGQAAKA